VSPYHASVINIKTLTHQARILPSREGQPERARSALQGPATRQNHQTIYKINQKKAAHRMKRFSNRLLSGTPMDFVENQTS
jgi:hypothetical protein